MRNAVERLAYLRQERDAAKEELQNKRQAWEQQNRDLLDRQAELAESVSKLEEQIREAALERWQENKAERQICPGVGIRVSERAVYDPHQALDWAKERGVCLQMTLDVEAFESLCKAASTRPEFVRVEEVATPTVSRDLTKFYPLTPKPLEEEGKSVA